jgi:hypothetical protein
VIEKPAVWAVLSASAWDIPHRKSRHPFMEIGDTAAVGAATGGLSSAKEGFLVFR